MVSGHFPGSGLVIQLFRQLAQPVSKRIVDYAATHPTFRRYFLLKPGRLYYQLEVNLQTLKSTAVVTKKGEKIPKVKAIKDEQAVELGSQLMIEIVIFGLLTLILMLEWLRSQRKSFLEESQRETEIAELERRKSEARERLEALVNETKSLRHRLYERQKETDEWSD